MITSSSVQQLKSGFRGDLIVPGDEEYDTARAVFNAAIDRRPALIARCDGADDLPDLVAMARRGAEGEAEDVLGRLEFVGGDMFEEVPAADIYVLKHIIHDWDDARCLRLLENCREAMQGDGRLLCVDAVLPPMGDTSGVPAKFLDVDMIVFDMGKERRAA